MLSLDSHSQILGRQFLDKLNVRLLGRILAGSFLVRPRLPLGLALQVEHAGLFGGVVPDGGLLEQGVQLQQFLVRRPFREGLHLFGGFVELLVGGKSVDNTGVKKEGLILYISDKGCVIYGLRELIRIAQKAILFRNRGKSC